MLRASMYRILLVAFLCAFRSHGQPVFLELASTDDGRQLYFSSTLRLGAAAPGRREFRIYRTAASGVELFAERGALASTNSFSSADGAVNAQVSGDGQTVGLTLQNVCEPGDPCTLGGGSRAELRGRNAAVLGPGSVYLS